MILIFGVSSIFGLYSIHDYSMDLFQSFLVSSDPNIHEAIVWIITKDPSKVRGQKGAGEGGRSLTPVSMCHGVVRMTEGDCNCGTGATQLVKFATKHHRVTLSIYLFLSIAYTKTRGQDGDLYKNTHVGQGACSMERSEMTSLVSCLWHCP